MTARQGVERCIRAALLAGCAFTIGFTLPAAAQQQAAQDQAEPTAQELEEIVVVGSRLRRDTFNSASPIQLITREESTLAGLSSASEILQSAGVTGGAAQINNAFGGFVTEGGPGANTISLRGLGEGRTLVLINGRRVTPAGTRGAVGAADLNVLPNALIERVEILRDGASSIYGSDAIAGVINVVTDTTVEGISVEAQYNRPVNEGGETGRFSIVGGAVGDNWKFSGSAEYYEREELTLAQRDWTQCNRDRYFDPETGATLDDIDPLTGKPKCYPISTTGSNGVTINTIGTSATAGVGAAGAVGSSFNRWRPNSAVTTGLVGFEGVGGGSNSLNVRDTFEQRMLDESLISPVQIWTGFLQGSYQLDALGDAEVYAESLFTRRESQQTGYRQLSLDYPRFSPLIPDNLQFSNFLPPQAITNGQRVGVRAFIGFGNDRSEQTVDYSKSTLGIKGDLEFLPNWKYDLNVSYALSDAEYTFEQFLIDRLSESLNLVEAPAGFNPALVRPGANGGAYTCAINITNPSRNCIPAPVLSAQTIGGVLPEDWKDFIFRPVTGTTTYDEWSVSGAIDGPLFELPAGDVAGVFGMEYRSAEIDDTPGADMLTGNLYNFSTAAATRGTDSVVEAFTEVEVPLLAKMPLVEELSVNLSARWTDYESYGSDWTYKVGGVYRPIDWVSLRASYGTSYRAPALFEQFQGATSGFLSSQIDPCNDYGAASKDPDIAAACAQQIPGQPNFQQTQSVRVISAGGADQGLEAETSENLTVGLILQPELPEVVGEIAFAVDYFDIQVDNGVARAGARGILDLCYNDPSFDPNSSFCNYVERDPATNQLTVYDSFTNISSQMVEGIDYNLRWTKEFGDFQLRLNAQVTQYLSQADKTFQDDPLTERNGDILYPEFTGVFSTTLEYQGWTFRYSLDYISSMDSYAFLEEDPATSIYDFEVPDYFLHGLSVQYETDDWSATLGVRNLMDRDPPKISSGYYNKVGDAPLYSGYDYIGRQLFINVSKSF